LKDVKLYNGRYTIQAEISSGGFATVYKAREEGRRAPIALKVGKVNADPGYAKSILEEAKIIGKLQHRNIVTLHGIPRPGKPDTDVGRAVDLPGDPYFFVMEYLGGGTLSDYLEQVDTLPPNEAAAIALEVARALDYMHREGYAHNDLKLENIVFREPVTVGKPYTPVLIDFGVATRIQPPSGITFYITPPEQIQRIKMTTPPELQDEIDYTKVDVWGLGVVLYRMLGGRLPFNGRSEKRITDRILNARPTSIQRLATHVAPEWDALVVDGCLAKDPKQRLSILELGQALRPLAEGAKATQAPKKKKKGGLLAQAFRRVGGARK
jgi:eukaryotic-like serine/threonine-protein kinase